MEEEKDIMEGAALLDAQREKRPRPSVEDAAINMAQWLGRGVATPLLLLLLLSAVALRRGLGESGEVAVASPGSAIVDLASSSKPRESMLPLVEIVPYSVLGTQLASGSIEQKASKPTKDIVVVDPAGLDFIQNYGPSGAGGASGAIYAWLQVVDEAKFHTTVREAIQSPGQAKVHTYGEHAVIHVASPNLGEARYDSQRSASEALTQAYSNVLKEFAICDAPRLRLLPISSGIFAGALGGVLPKMTFEALDKGFRLLDSQTKDLVLQKLDHNSAEMCIFGKEDFPLYRRACGSCATP